jgi:hypothetical protein
VIRYTLTCDNDHQFESWFQSSAAYDKLRGAGMVKCETCGSIDVTKSLMVPGIPKKGRALTNDAPTPLEKMRKDVEDNSEYVGTSFAVRAKDMHDGVEPAQSIYGEANLKEVKSLVDDGVPIVPLPFVPKKKAN